MAQSSGSEQRIAMRVAPDQKALIEEGARARGQSITDFMLTLALREAKAALVEQTVFMADSDAYDAFLAALDRPPEAKPEFRHLVQNNRRSKWTLEM